MRSLATWPRSTRRVGSPWTFAPRDPRNTPLKIADLNWMQVAEYLERDQRAVVPLGSVEQHAYLSLATDALLAERVAVEAAEPLGVVVFPVIAYGITPYTLAYPGSVSLRVSTY